jgi:hypothetical protein
MVDRAALITVCEEMVEVIPATEPLTLLEDIARFLDYYDDALGRGPRAEDGREMQHNLRGWSRRIQEALSGG